MNLKKKVLLIQASEYSVPPRAQKEAKSLALAGYSVEVLCWDREKAFPSNEKLRYYNVLRYQVNAPRAAGIRLFPFMMQWWFFIFRHILKDEYYIIHACDFDTLPPVILAKFLRRTSYIVYDIFDSYAEKVFGVPDGIRYLIRIVDRLFMRFVDAIIICEDRRKSYLGHIAKIKPVEVILNVPEYQELHTENKENPYLVINYCGFINENRGIYQIGEAIKNTSNARLQVFGLCPDKAILDYLNQIENVEYYGQIPNTEALKFMKNSDLVVALYDPQILAHRFPSSNKVFEAMLCGKPILTNYGTALADFVLENEIGYVVEYDDIPGIRNIINKILNNCSDSLKYGLNGYELFKSEYNWGIMAERMLKTYKNILNPKR